MNPFTVFYLVYVTLSAVVLSARWTMSIAALSGGRPLSEHPPPDGSSRSGVRREHIERVLRECNGNVSRAARALGVHRRTLQYKLAKFPVSR
jgi:ActR/RegA family two-component response regulator